jgi:hypothetical protein
MTERTSWPRPILRHEILSRESHVYSTRGEGWKEALRLKRIGADVYWLERRKGVSEEAAVNAAIAAALDASLI